MSINDYIEKIKYFIGTEKGKDILTVIIVILVGLSSFGLGRMSKNTSVADLSSTHLTMPANALMGQESAINGLNEANIGSKRVLSTIKSTQKDTDISAKSGNFFASKRGHKYYTNGCTSGNNLKEENKIYFQTKEEAERAGYTLSSSC